VCCFLVSLIKRSGEEKRDVFFLRLGMFFTAAADLMMVCFKLNAAGLVLFCVVQLIYRARFKGLQNAVFVLGAAAFVFAVSLPLYTEFRLSLAYAVCLVSAVSASTDNYRKHPSRAALLAFSGMTLFLLCDINVALFNLFAGYEFYRLFQVLLWVFYLPSQLLISLSGKRLTE